MGITRVPIRLAVLLSCLAIFAGDCDSSAPPTSRDRTQITITLQNVETSTGPENEAVHIFAPGETFPCCRLNAGGGSRTLERELGVADDITFAAGRDGDLIGSATCTLTQSGFSSEAARVEWRGASGFPQGLVCGAGFSGSN